MTWLTHLRRWLPWRRRTTERRQHPRYMMQMKVDVVTPGKTYLGRTADLSLSGMGLFIDAELEVGERVELRYELGDGSPRKKVASIVRNRNGHRYGLEFEE